MRFLIFQHQQHDTGDNKVNPFFVLESGQEERSENSKPDTNSPSIEKGLTGFYIQAVQNVNQPQHVAFGE